MTTRVGYGIRSGVEGTAYDRAMSHGRVDYDGDGLTEDQLLDTPYAQVRAWVDEAVAGRRSDPTCSSRSPSRSPRSTARATRTSATVLMRFLDERGPGFVTALTSTKGHELLRNPVGRRGPDLAGDVPGDPVPRAGRRGDREEVEKYFDSRPWASRISAWASRQSEPIGSRAELEAQYAARAARFPDHGGERDVPVPDFWGGFRVVPDEVEFWAGRRNRLHDRLVYLRTGEGDLGDASSWELQRRQP